MSQTEEVHDPSTYHTPKIVSSPSLLNQVIYHPLSIIDPYIIALQQNYYHPIAQDPISITVTEDTEMTNTSNNSPGCQKMNIADVITVEHSLMAITDLIKEIKVDDPPMQPEALPQPEPPVKSSSYRHRFPLYRKSAYINHVASTTQWNQFKSFIKCIKAADSMAQVLPIRSDINIYPTS